MDRDRVLSNQTVVVRDGRIAEVGPAGKVKIPSEAVRIDGRGKFLMPGIAEMHGHLPPAQAGEQAMKNTLYLYIANGVTVVRGMQGQAHHPATRDRIARGELIGPTLFVSSPAMTGGAVQTPEQGGRLVREYKQAGFDLLKIHEGLTPATYDTIAGTARQLGLLYGGHVPDPVGLVNCLKAGQSTIDHLDGYLEALEGDDSPVKNADGQTRARKLPLHADMGKLPALVKLTVETKGWVVPTMALWRVLYNAESPQVLDKMEGLEYMPKATVESWKQAFQKRQTVFDDPRAAARLVEIRNQVLKELARAGAGIMMGSDSPQQYSVPGFSMRRELADMVKAGMANFEILQSGTINPARYFKQEAEFGTVAPGRRADLILLGADPRKDVDTIFTRREGVMARGVWRTEADLKKGLAEIAASYR